MRLHGVGLGECLRAAEARELHELVSAREAHASGTAPSECRTHLVDGEGARGGHELLVDLLCEFLPDVPECHGGEYDGARWRMRGRRTMLERRLTRLSRHVVRVRNAIHTRRHGSRDCHATATRGPRPRGGLISGRVEMLGGRGLSSGHRCGRCCSCSARHGRPVSHLKMKSILSAPLPPSAATRGGRQRAPLLRLMHAVPAERDRRG